MARSSVVILVVAVLVTTVSIYAAFILVPSSACRDFTAATLTIDKQQQISVALADTPVEQQLGLSGCSELLSKHGMYFIFPIKTDAVFWMKDMLFPIDILWLADDKVIGITANIPPPLASQEKLPTYAAPAPIDAVLEISAGQAQALGIHVDSTIQLNN